MELGSRFQDASPSAGVWTATHKQAAGKKTASFAHSVLNQPPSVSWSPKQMGGTVSWCTLISCLFVIYFLLQDSVYLYGHFSGIKGAVGVTVQCDCSRLKNMCVYVRSLYLVHDVN